MAQRYFKDSANEVYVYDKDDEPAEGLKEITYSDALKLLNPQVPEVVPSECTPAQGLIALFVLKQITEDDITAVIGAIQDPVQRYTAQIGYQRATVWVRGSATMQRVQDLLQLSEADMVELFKLAVTIQV